MDYKPLGNTGLVASVAGLGCGGNSRLGLGRGASVDDCVAVVRTAIDLGVNFLDAARTLLQGGVVAVLASGLGRSTGGPAEIHPLVIAAAVAPGGVLTCEHLLLSLVNESECGAAQTLAGCGFERERVGQTIAFVQGAVPPPEELVSPVVLSPRVERVLTNAGREAAIQKAEQVDTLHLLVGLLREKQGIAVLALESPGVGFELVGAAISRAMRDGVTDPS